MVFGHSQGFSLLCKASQLLRFSALSSCLNLGLSCITARCIVPVLKKFVLLRRKHRHPASGRPARRRLLEARGRGQEVTSRIHTWLCLLQSSAPWPASGHTSNSSRASCSSFHNVLRFAAFACRLSRSSPKEMAMPSSQEGTSRKAPIDPIAVLPKYCQEPCLCTGFCQAFGEVFAQSSRLRCFLPKPSQG